MKITLKNVTVSFPNFFSKGKLSNNYDGAFLYDKDSEAHKELEAAIDQAGKDKYADKWAVTKKAIVASGKYPVRNGDSKADKYAGYEGRLFSSAKNTIAPRVVNRDTSVITESDGLIYAGAIVNAVVDVSVFENDFGKFVGIRLLGVQFVKAGERLSAAPMAGEDDFKPLTDGADADDL